MQLKSKWLVATLVCIVTMVFLVILIPSSPKEPVPPSARDIVFAELAALKEGDIDAAYTFVSTEFKDETSLRAFSRFSDRYDVFATHTAASVISELMENDAGVIKVALTGLNQVVTTLDFNLVKENNEWKIMRIAVIPSPDALASNTDDISNLLAKDQLVLPNAFDNARSRYTVKYPERWMRERLDNGTLILSGSRGTRAYYSSVNIQTILTKKTGGQFQSVADLTKDIKRQVKRMSTDPVFIESGPISVTEKSGREAKGEYLIFTYSYKGHTYQQWDVVVSRNDGQVFYVWAYTSPIRQYDSDLPLARAILASWEIY